MAQLCRADSRHIEVHHTDLYHVFRHVMGPMLPNFPLTPLVVCNSFKLVMDSVFLESMCFPAFGVVHFQRFPCGSSCTDSNDPQQLGISSTRVTDSQFSGHRALSNVLPVPLVVATRSVVSMSSCSCRATVATHMNLAYHSVMPIVQHALIPRARAEPPLIAMAIFSAICLCSVLPRLLFLLSFTSSALSASAQTLRVPCQFSHLLHSPYIPPFPTSFHRRHFLLMLSLSRP